MIPKAVFHWITTPKRIMQNESLMMYLNILNLSIRLCLRTAWTNGWINSARNMMQILSLCLMYQNEL